MTMPTSCRAGDGAHRRAVGDRHAGVARGAAVHADRLQPLPFKPRPRGDDQDRPICPALRTVITGPPGNANTARAAVTLPAGIGVNLDALQRACSLGAAGRRPRVPSARARRAAPSARSPLLPPLTGPVFLAALPGEALPGLRVDLAGVVSLTLTAAASSGREPDCAPSSPASRTCRSSGSSCRSTAGHGDLRAVKDAVPRAAAADRRPS